jgi:hypothetical protein
VRGVGWARRKCAIEEGGKASGERLENGRVGTMSVSLAGSDKGTIAGAGSSSIIAEVSNVTSVESGGRTRVPSANPLKIRLTAMTPAAPVNAARSAPTYPGVFLARARKSKSPERRSLAA